jgi:hypothetical protein
MRRKSGVRRRGGLAVAAALVIAVVLGVPAALGAYTTTNPAVDSGVVCLNGNPAVNCNIYTAKQYVWMNGGPVSAALGAGTYFFAVMVPGHQNDPNDGSTGNLSSPNDSYANRTFSVDANGVVTYTGNGPSEIPHDFDSANNKIRLMPYGDTTNGGGVYIMDVCKLSDVTDAGPGDITYPVVSNACKKDAFRAPTDAPCVGDCNPSPAADLTISKDATGAFDQKYIWSITKDVDKTLVQNIGGTATFTYTVKLTHDGGTTPLNYGVAGTISVFNPNDDPVTVDTVTDSINDLNSNCAVALPVPPIVVPPGSRDFAYSCPYSAPPAAATETNTAGVSWSDQTLATNGPLAAGSASFPLSFTFGFSGTYKDTCVAVTDNFHLSTLTPVATSIGSACVTDPNNPTTITYTKTVPVPTNGCVLYDNTATFTTNDSATTRSASKEVEVCGPARTGALTMGFWQNKNGQALIKNTAWSGTACATLLTFVKSFLPFSDLKVGSTTYPDTCQGIADYDTAVFKAAQCSGPAATPCNAMLKAQMLATAFDVYFSAPAHNGLGASVSLGAVTIDLTHICKMIDASGGTATCSGTYEDTSPAFSPLVCPATNVLALLQTAAGYSNVGGSVWYGVSKAMQVRAKDTFDAINNQVAFSCP